MQASRWLNLESRLAFADGDSEAGLRAARALARLRDSLQEVPVLIHYLVGLSCEKDFRRVVREVLESPEPWASRPALLDEIEAMLPTGDWMAEARRTVTYEAVWMTILVHRGSRQQGDWPARASWAMRYQLGPLAAAQALGRARQVVDLVPVPYGEAGAGLAIESERDLIDVLWAACFEASFDGWRLTELAPALLGEVGPGDVRHRYGEGLLHTVHKIQLTASQRQLVRAAIALRQIGIARGAYPRQRPDLAELTETEAFTGRQILYRPHDDGTLRLEVAGARELTRQLFPSSPDENLDLEVFGITLPPIR